MVNVVVSASRSLKKLIEDKIKSFIVEIATQKIQEEFTPVFIQKALEIYRRDLVALEGAWGKKDPTSPSSLEDAFVSYMQANAKDLIKVSKKGIRLDKKYLSDFGFPGNISKTETSKLRLLYFYFSGIIGSFGFVDRKTFEVLAGKPAEDLGRFGLGFFIERSKYEKARLKIPRLPSFASIESPLSGRPGIDVVAKAFEESTKEIRSILYRVAEAAVKKFNNM